eukprot:gene17900-23517_t
MTQHIIGDGAYWTQLHGPQISCSVIGQFPDAAEEETKKTLEYMYKKGINNVRGAEYCKPTNFTVEDAKQLSFAFIHHIPGSNQSDVEKVFIRSIQSDTASPTRTSNRQETTTPIRNSNEKNSSNSYKRKRCRDCGDFIPNDPDKPYCYDCYLDNRW